MALKVLGHSMEDLEEVIQSVIKRYPKQPHESSTDLMLNGRKVEPGLDTSPRDTHYKHSHNFSSCIGLALAGINREDGTNVSQLLHAVAREYTVPLITSECQSFVHACVDGSCEAIIACGFNWDYSRDLMSHIARVLEQDTDRALIPRIIPPEPFDVGGGQMTRYIGPRIAFKSLLLDTQKSVLHVFEETSWHPNHVSAEKRLR